MGTESSATAIGLRTRVGSSPVVRNGGTSAWSRLVTRGGAWVLAASLLFGSFSLVFLLVTPTFYGPDEVFQFDRVMAASHGDLVVTPGQFRLSVGASKLQTAFIRSGEYLGTSTFGDRAASERPARPSYEAAGGNARPASAVTNYMSQHPPLYYALMGGLVSLVPGADTMHGDLLVMVIRVFNVLLLLTLPLLFFLIARKLAGDGILARAAAFVPLLVPGLTRSATTINNDNLTIVLCVAVLLFAVSVMRGDRSISTAGWLALLCVGVSLSKGTGLIALVIVPLAYLVQLARTRRWPRPAVLGVLGIGAAGSALWWVRNLIEYRQVQPGGTAGAQLISALGPVRPPGAAIDLANFWRHVYLLLPSRFWGALGMLEPPRLPWAMIWVLCGALVLGLAAAVASMPGRRPEMILLIVLPAGMIVGVAYAAYLHYQTFLAIPGLQGRYLYPTSFGLLFPFAVLAVLVLRRGSRWAPTLLTGCALLVWGWAVYTTVDTLWLPSDVALTPGTWRSGFRQAVAFGPLPGLVTMVLALLAALGVVAGTVMTVLACRAYPGRPWQEELRLSPVASAESAPPSTSAASRSQRPELS
jgi:hypothetical protein